MADEDLVYNKEFLRWEVKPIWSIVFPSILVGIEEGSFKIFGVDRGSLDIVRNWEKIQSVEQFNQGFVAKPEDFTFTIAVKERGASFERLRRLAIGGILFDITCGLLVETSGPAYGDRPEESGSDAIYEEDEDGNPVLDEDGNPVLITPAVDSYIPWMDGFEKYQGCLVQREGQTVELASFPVREFECEFLRHQIMSNTDGKFNTSTILTEGDGTYPHLANLSL